MLVLAFAFPPLMFLVLAGVFAADQGSGFTGLNGDDFYVVSYLAVPAASLALTGLPVQLGGAGRRRPRHHGGWRTGRAWCRGADP